MDSLLHIVLVALALAAIVGVLMMDQTRSLLFYIPNMIADTITDKLVGINPISILRSFIKYMTKKLDGVQEALNSMRAVRQKTRDSIEKRTQEMNQALSLAAAAERSGQQEAQMEQMAKAARRKNYIAKLQNSLAFADETINGLERAEKIITYHINNSRDEVEMLKDDNELALQTLAAASDARDAMDGDTDKADIARRATEVVHGRTAKARSEVESLLSLLQTPGTEMDLTKLAEADEGQRMLEEFKARLNDAEQGTKKKQLGSGAASQFNTVAPVSSNQWAKLRREK